MTAKEKLGLVVLLLGLSGCFVVGRDFPADPVKDIQANVTTKQQIFETFGQPFEQGLETGGYETWTYYYASYAPGGLESRKQLQLSFNKNGTVRAYSFTAK